MYHGTPLPADFPSRWPNVIALREALAEHKPPDTSLTGLWFVYPVDGDKFHFDGWGLAGPGAGDFGQSLWKNLIEQGRTRNHDWSEARALICSLLANGYRVFWVDSYG